MSMTMSEMIEAMEKSQINGGSQLNMRSEELQNKKTVSRIPRLKNALKKKRVLLLVAELAFPFNPETGEADENFNPSHKYRPPFSATTLALAMKDAANNNEKLKGTLMKKAGMSEWDTSDISTFTKEDWEIFIKYRVPRIFSISAVHVDIPAMGTGKYGRDYAVTINRDKNLDVIGDMPICLKANKFFRDRAFEEVSSYREKIKKGEIKDTEKQQKDTIAKIYGRVPVTDDRPNNFVYLYELPVDNQGEIANELMQDVTMDSIKSCECISRYKKGIRLAVESYLHGEWAKFDKNFDFYEIEMTCPASGDDSTDQGKAQIGQDTKFEKPTVGFKSREEYEIEPGKYKTDSITEVVRELIDNDLDIEQRVRRSVGIPMLGDEVESQLLTSVCSVIDIDDDEFITKRVIENNQEFIMLAFGDEGSQIIEEVVSDVSDREEGNLDDIAAKKESKVYDLSAMESADTDDFEEIGLALEEEDKE